MAQELQPQKKLLVEIKPDSFGTMRPGTDNKNVGDPPGLTVTNRGQFTSEFHVAFIPTGTNVEHVADWFDPIRVLNIDSGKRNDPPEPIHVKVPKDTALAGTYNVEIRVTDWANPGDPDSGTVRLIVQREGDYSVSAGPGEVSDSTPLASASYTLSVTNNANAPLKVRCKDAPLTAPFTFGATPPDSEVKPTETKSFTVTVKLKGDQSLPTGQSIDLVTVGTYQLAGGGSETPIEHTQQVLWPGPPLSISTDPSSLSLVPDQEAKLTLTVTNHGPNEARIALSVEGLAIGWVEQIIPSQMNFLPGSSATATLVIRAPKDVALAGGYPPLLVRAASQNTQATAEVGVPITVELVGGSEIELTLKDVRNGSEAHFQVSIRNDYNASLRVHLSANQPEFALSPAEIEVLPGDTDQDAVLAVKPKEPVTEPRTDRFMVKMHQIKDGKPEDTSVPAEVRWMPSLPPTTTLTIDARQENGTPYSNDLDSEVTIAFLASGQWIAIPVTDPTPNLPKGPVDAAGYNFKQSNCLCPSYNLGALVVRTQDGKCITGGKQGIITLQSRQIVHFVMNDVNGLYFDNDGNLTVVISGHYVTVFDDRDYSGFSQILIVGRYDWGQIHNDTVSSLKIPEGMKVTLYTDAHFQGMSKTLTQDTDYVGDDFNDKTSSIIVSVW